MSQKQLPAWGITAAPYIDVMLATEGVSEYRCYSRTYLKIVHRSGNRLVEWA